MRSLDQKKATSDQEHVSITKVYAMVNDVIFGFLITQSFLEYESILVPLSFSFNLFMLVFIYAAIVLSWVGYRKSIMKKPYKGSIRFFVDLLILFIYFTLLMSVGTLSLALWAFASMFLCYSIWDILKFSEYPEEKFSRIKISVSGFLLSLPIAVSYSLLPNDWFLTFLELLLVAGFWYLKLKGPKKI